MPSISREADTLRRMVTQLVTLAINNGSSTGSTNLATPIDITQAYFLEPIGGSINQATGVVAPRITSFDGTTISATRSGTGTTGDYVLGILATGVPA